MAEQPQDKPEEREPYDDEEWQDRQDDENDLCTEEGGAGPCRHFACDDWGGDGLCFLTMGD